MTVSALPTRWILQPRPRPGAALRLLCIPHAGGGASAFRGWADALPPEVEVCPVQLPGRENRILEPAVDRMAPLVDALAEQVAAADDLPFALFGHSNGALIGFELARRLREQGRPGPLHLFASGRRAPDLPNPLPDMHALPDDAFMRDLVSLGGTPREVAESPELLRLLLPLLRADVALNETYAFAEQAPLECGITAYGGVDDPKAACQELHAWRRHTRGPFAVRLFPGDHFFAFGPARELVLRTLGDDVHDLLVRAARGLAT
jgi:medium-chain acyl-[acyl-carrier-protein] hydrolase